MSAFNTAFRLAFRTAWSSVWGITSSLASRVAALFAAGEQGAWYDESDMSTLYQDSAGTTPVTAVEQFIGRMLDKSGRNNHVTQAVAGSRLVVSARVNLLTYSEDFTNAVWTVQGITKTSNTITVIATGANKELGEGFTSVAGANYSLMFEVGSGTATACKLAMSDRTAHANGRYFSLAAGTISGSTNLAAGTNCLVVGSSIALNSSTGRYICTVVFTTLNAATYFATVGIVDAVGTDTATAGKSLTATFAQLEIGSTATRYQRVNTSTDYDTINFPAYAKLDGVDDSMSSATGGGGTAGFFFCRAIRPTGGAGLVRTLWSDAQANAGYRVRLNAANQLELSSGSGTPLAPPVQSAAVNSATGGTGLAASTAYFYVVTALNGKGESLKSNEVTVTTTAGTTDSNAISWAAASGAVSYRIYRGTATAAQNLFYAVGNVLAFTDTGAASTAGTPPTISETAYTAAATAAATVIGTTALVTAWDDGTNLNVQLDSGTVASVARSVVAAGTAAFTIGKQNAAAAGFFTGNLYPEVYRQGSGLTAAERAQVRAYVKSKAGL